MHPSGQVPSGRVSGIDWERARVRGRGWSIGFDWARAERAFLGGVFGPSLRWAGTGLAAVEGNEGGRRDIEGVEEKALVRRLGLVWSRLVDQPGLKRQRQKNQWQSVSDRQDSTNGDGNNDTSGSDSGDDDGMLVARQHQVIAITAVVRESRPRGEISNTERMIFGLCLGS